MLLTLVLDKPIKLLTKLSGLILSNLLMLLALLLQHGPFAVQLLGMQGVVTYMSPVEVFATRIKTFDHQKVCLIA